jgi:hypothetical protein
MDNYNERATLPMAGGLLLYWRVKGRYLIFQLGS